MHETHSKQVKELDVMSLESKSILLLEMLMVTSHMSLAFDAQTPLFFFLTYFHHFKYIPLSNL